MLARSACIGPAAAEAEACLSWKMLGSRELGIFVSPEGNSSKQFRRRHVVHVGSCGRFYGLRAFGCSSFSPSSGYSGTVLHASIEGESLNQVPLQRTVISLQETRGLYLLLFSLWY